MDKAVCKKTLLIILTLVFSIGCAFTAFAKKEEYVDYTIDGASWEDTGSSILATWEHCESKSAYTVMLYVHYKGARKLESHKTSNNYYDFTESLAEYESGSYYFAVWPVKDRSCMVYSEDLNVPSDYASIIRKYNRERKKEIEESIKAARSTTDTFIVDTAAPVSDGWNVVKDGKGWCYYSNHNFVRDAWVEYENNWYYIGKDGIMLTGWQYIQQKGYYFALPGDTAHPEGALYRSEVTPDGYLVDSDGCIVKKA